LVQCLPLTRLDRLQLVWRCCWLLERYPLECLDLAAQLALETSGVLAAGASGGRQLGCCSRPEEVERLVVVSIASELVAALLLAKKLQHLILLGSLVIEQCGTGRIWQS
jgi:hypothetical protein